MARINNFKQFFFNIVILCQRSHIVETEPFGDTFGPKAQRKRPRLDVGTFEELSKSGLSDNPSGSVTPSTTPGTSAPTHADYVEPIYSKGTSRRIYGELYKVIDSSDVVLHVLDARDPLGTMCTSVLDYMKKEKAHKQVVLVLNKCDLVPAWVTVRVLFVRDWFLFLSIVIVSHGPSQVLLFSPKESHCYVCGRSTPSFNLPLCLVPRYRGSRDLDVGKSR